MNDVAAWSLPLGRWFGVAVRVHLALLLFSVFTVMRVYATAPAYAGAALVLQLMLFVAVLLHEFGHCFAARHVDGDADEVVLWPLGGLANCQVPNLPWPQFFTAAGGPAVNLLLAVGCLGGLTAFGLVPPLNPLWDPYSAPLQSWFVGGPAADVSLAQAFLARFFWVNWLLFAVNVFVAGYPLDGGRMLQAALWPRWGFHASMRTAVYVGYGASILLVGVAFVFHEKLAANAMLLFALALIIFLSCRQQQLQLEMGDLGDDSLFGYDFSQGYTSLERSERNAPAARAPRQSFWKRWLAQRAAARRQREAEADQADQLRLDELLAKIAERGEAALSGEESRFLKRMSAKFRNKSKQ